MQVTTIREANGSRAGSLLCAAALMCRCAGNTELFAFCHSHFQGSFLGDAEKKIQIHTTQMHSIFRSKQTTVTITTSNKPPDDNGFMYFGFSGLSSMHSMVVFAGNFILLLLWVLEIQ
jgi:hypothetical protein